jgi:hypothetical protein
MTPSEFELLVKYMYTGEICFHNVKELCFGIYISARFNLADVKKECLKRLQSKLDEDAGNAVTILHLDGRFRTQPDNTELFVTIDTTIENNFRAILSSQAIGEIDKDLMHLLLGMETSEDVPEIEVFRALMKWTGACCHKLGVNSEEPKELQAAAGDLVHLIRFNQIPIDLLGAEVVSSGLLSNDLIARVFQRIYNEDTEVPFCTEVRMRTAARVPDQEVNIGQLGPGRS